MASVLMEIFNTDYGTDFRKYESTASYYTENK